MRAVSCWAALDCTGRLRNHDQGTPANFRLSLHRHLPRAARGHRVVFRPEFLPRFPRGVHRLPHDPRGRPGLGGEVSRRAGLPDRRLSTGLELQLRRRRQDLCRPRIRIMGTRVRLWRWSYRWFQPRQKEEYRVDITPSGQFAGFEHQLPEEAARSAVTPAQARALAEAFLRARLARDPASLDFVEASEIERLHRTDRTFTWKERDFNLHDATNRVEVTLYGDEVAGYREYLKIPEQWTRDYQRLRSKNDMAEYVDTALTVALMLGLLATIVLRVRGQDVRWRRAAVIGSVGAALSFLASLNQFPLQEFGYPTTDSYGSFVSTQALQALVTALGFGGLLFVIAAGAEPLYRAAFPGRISLGNLFRPSGLRTKRFFLGAILGISLTGTFIAYQTVFYIVASRHGASRPVQG